MQEILIVVALIIVIALLFWLDKKAENEGSEVERICNEIFIIFNKIRWRLNSSELKEIFSDKQFSHMEESDDLAGTGYADKIEGHETLVSFYFLKPDKESLVGIYFRILRIPIDKSNSLFSKLCERYGFPLNRNDAEGKSVLWDLDDSVLIFEVLETGTGGQELQIRFWEKEFYTKM